MVTCLNKAIVKKALSVFDKLYDSHEWAGTRQHSNLFIFVYLMFKIDVNLEDLCAYAYNNLYMFYYFFLYAFSVMENKTLLCQCTHVLCLQRNKQAKKRIQILCLQLDITVDLRRGLAIWLFFHNFRDSKSKPRKPQILYSVQNNIGSQIFRLSDWEMFARG